jgi:DNA uptake protein ComE-like DNA-binding protein
MRNHTRRPRTASQSPARPAPRRRATVLPAILVAIAMLALAGYRYADLMTSEYIAATKTSKVVRAKALADGAVHYVAALVGDPQSMQNLNYNVYDNDASFHDKTVQAGGDAAGGKQGYFSLVAPVDPNDLNANGQVYRYGVIDETGKINLNSLLKLDKTGQYGYNVLMMLPNMTDDIANSILFWLDPAATARSSGAGADYYSGLTPSYQARNGPMDSLEELLLVKGVTPQLLYGGDKNRNGVLDTDEMDDGSGNPIGWAPYLTIYSREQNIAADGSARIYLNDADLTTLQTKLSTAVGDDLANYIIAYRMYGAASNAPTTTKTTGRNFSGQAPKSGGVSNGPLSGQNAGGMSGGSTGGTTSGTTGGTTSGATGGATATSSQMGTKIGGTTLKSGGSGGKGMSGGGSNNISSIFSLINSYVSIPSTDPNGQPTLYPSPLNDSGQLAELLPILLDKTTTTKGTELPARINVNTAPQAVLMTLPYLAQADVDTILQTRPTPQSGNLAQPEYQTITWLITEAGFSASAVQQLEKYITTKSQVYRVQALGYFEGGGGPTARVEAVVDANNGRPRILYYRDISDLGKGFDLSTNGQQSGQNGQNGQ